MPIERNIARWQQEARATKVEPLEDKDFVALEEEDDFISMDEFLKRRGIV